jgi:hypothetical protein
MRTQYYLPRLTLSKPFEMKSFLYLKPLCQTTVARRKESTMIP